MKDLAILSLKLIFFILTSLEKSQQSIYSYIYFALAIINLKIVLKELLSPADLSGAQIFYIYETIEVIVIYEDKNLIFVIFYIVMSCLKVFDNSQKLAIMGLILYFHLNHFLRKKMLLSVTDPYLP